MDQTSNNDKSVATCVQYVVIIKMCAEFFLVILQLCALYLSSNYSVGSHLWFLQCPLSQIIIPVPLPYPATVIAVSVHTSHTHFLACLFYSIPFPLWLTAFILVWKNNAKMISFASTNWYWQFIFTWFLPSVSPTTRHYFPARHSSFLLPPEKLIPILDGRVPEKTTRHKLWESRM